MKQALFSYVTIAFIAPVVFLCCINDRDGYSHGLRAVPLKYQVDVEIVKK